MTQTLSAARTPPADHRDFPANRTPYSHGNAVLRDVHDMGLPHVTALRLSRLFLLEGAADEEVVERIASDLLADPITETFACVAGGDDRTLPGEGFDAAIEVHLKGGVMDPVAASTLTAIRDMLGLARDESSLAISTARLYQVAGVRNVDEAAAIARRLLANDCIEDIYLTSANHHYLRPDHLPVAPVVRTFALRHVSIRQSTDAELTKLS